MVPLLQLLNNIIEKAAYTIYETDSGIYVKVPPVGFAVSVAVKLSGLIVSPILTPEII